MTSSGDNVASQKSYHGSLEKSPTSPSLSQIYTFQSDANIYSIAHNNESFCFPKIKFSACHPFSYLISDIELKTNICVNFSRSNFRDFKYIGTGSTSWVHSAIWNGSPVAIKILKGRVRQSHEREMEFEMGVLSRLCHPNIVRVIGTGQDPRRFLVMEYLSGGSLDKLVCSKSDKKTLKRYFKYSNSTSSNLPLLDIILLASEIANALKYLHEDFHDEATVIHRDLKPHNIGFSPDGRLKLFDFGVSTCVKKRTLSTDFYDMTGNIGTPLYMAPEVALRKPYSEKVDIYSFGVILWQLTSGRIPFEGMTKVDFMERVVIEGFRPAIRKDLPFELFRLIEQCWHSNPNHRPSSGEVVDILNMLKSEYLLKPKWFRFFSFFSSRRNKVMDSSLVDEYLLSRMSPKSKSWM